MTVISGIHWPVNCSSSFLIEERIELFPNGPQFDPFCLKIFPCSI